MRNLAVHGGNSASTLPRDAAPEEEVDETSSAAAEADRGSSRQALLPHAQTRGELRAAGKLKTRDVIEHAKAREDGKALHTTAGAQGAVRRSTQAAKVGGR